MAMLKQLLQASLIALSILPALGLAADSADSAEGELRKVDRNARRVIVAHGDWDKGGMHAMTMAMNVEKDVDLAKLQKGDKVRFEVTRQGGDWVITRITLKR